MLCLLVVCVDECSLSCSVVARTLEDVTQSLETEHSLESFSLIVLDKRHYRSIDGFVGDELEEFFELTQLQHVAESRFCVHSLPPDVV
jgi:galactose-1-phosphate uridylyltransferase